MNVHATVPEISVSFLNEDSLDDSEINSCLSEKTEMSSAGNDSFIVFQVSDQSQDAEGGKLSDFSDDSSSFDRNSSVFSKDTGLEMVGDSLQRQGRLLLVSLLENFCSLYDRNPEKNHKLFVILCRKLSSMGILNSTDFVDEAANIRTVYKRAFRDLVFEAVKGLEGDDEEKKLIKEDGESSEDEMDSEEESEDISSTFNDLLTSDKSRYAEDFIELCCLGKGGFGRVFKARNKLDGRMYAIKKIRFSSIYSTRYQRIVREVKSLAQMDHPNIVRYNAAWIEEISESSPLAKDDSSENYDPTIETATDEIEESRHPSNLAMYIQMELCQYTLADWLLRRNALISDSGASDQNDFPMESYRMICSSLSGTADINVHEVRRIFKGIVKGLQYIHSNSLIHRDLKPHNIFFYGPEHIPKIGDFGLVSDFQQPFIDENSPPTSPGSSNLTSGLGTHVYGSPEQLNGCEYDEKTDIYSLGIICFELFHPFSTLMERSRVLTDLKKSKKFPTEFLRRWPKEAAFIWCCLASDPANRPSVEEILDCELLDQDLEEHFLRLAEDNEDLRELLRVQFEENNNLKRENQILKEKLKAYEQQ